MECHMQKPTGHRQVVRGFYALEMIVGVTILLSLMGLGVRYMSQHMQQEINRAAAWHLQQVTQAAHRYLQDHYATFQHNGGAIGWQELVSGGYLSGQLQQHNPYGQSYTIQVAPHQEGLLQVVLTTHAGQAIDEASLRAITAQAGGNTGYASHLQEEGSDIQTITGSQQGWELKSMPIAQGHLASLSILHPQEVLDSATFLRRTYHAGHPEYNRMESDLKIDKDKQIIFDQNHLTLSRNGLSWGYNEQSSLELKRSGNRKYIEITSPGKRGELWSDALYLNDRNSPQKNLKLSTYGISWGTTGPYRFSLDRKWNDERYIQINSPNAETTISAKAVTVTHSRAYPGWNLWNLSRIRSQIDATGVRIPYYIFENTANADFSKFGKYVCGNKKGSFSDEDGKLFIMAQDKQGSHLFFCVAGYPKKVMAEYLD